MDKAGEIRYLVEGGLRAIHRKVFRDRPPYKIPAPYHSFNRGETVKLTFGLHPISALIKKGHRIRIVIAGADKDSLARYPERRKARDKGGDRQSARVVCRSVHCFKELDNRSGDIYFRCNWLTSFGGEQPTCVNLM